MSTQTHLYGPQTLYRHWEEGQWSPWDVDLAVDREQWDAMEDRSLIVFVLGSLMVAEERITTKFSGLVGAQASERRQRSSPPSRWMRPGTCSSTHASKMRSSRSRR